jgi:hypothetical protein
MAHTIKIGIGKNTIPANNNAVAENENAIKTINNKR